MTTCVYCGKEIELLGGMWFASPTGSACYENRHSGHKPAQADALKMTCPHDEQQCESPRCLGDDPAYSDRRCKAAQAKAAAQPQSMLPAETSGFEHAVDELAQKIIDENKGTSMSAAYRQVAKDLYLALILQAERQSRMSPGSRSNSQERIWQAPACCIQLAAERRGNLTS